MHFQHNHSMNAHDGTSPVYSRYCYEQVQLISILRSYYEPLKCNWAQVWASYWEWMTVNIPAIGSPRTWVERGHVPITHAETDEQTNKDSVSIVLPLFLSVI